MFFFDFFCVSYSDCCFRMSPISFLFHRQTFWQVEVELFIHYELNGASGRVGRSKPAGYSDQKGRKDKIKK